MNKAQIDMEIYTLSLRLPLYSLRAGNHEWEIIVEIPAIFSLYDLHSYILEIVGFDNDHAYTFFAGRSPTNNKIIFSEKPGNPNSEANFDNVLLNDIYPLKGLRLYYLFDFGDKWVFEIRKRRTKKIARDIKNYPKVIESTGKNPDQYKDWAW